MSAFHKAGKTLLSQAFHKKLTALAALLVFTQCWCGEVKNHAEDNRQILLQIWKDRVEENRGVHTWTNKNDGMRVFQEWISLLELHRHAPRRQKRKTGKMLEAYVVGQNMQALGTVGTGLPLPGFKNADFDMALLGCISLLGLFQEDTLLLTDSTYVHLIKNVVRCWGQEPKYYFDVLMLSFQETENHVFMIETTRYLTNQFIWKNRRGLKPVALLRDSLLQRNIILDNEGGIIYTMLLKQMHQILKAGYFEFNAKIYQRFTLHALDNLYSFAEDSLIIAGSAAVLDYTAAKFAFQSIFSVRLGPYRRNAEKFMDTAIMESDEAASFFGVQSGSLPWGRNKIIRYWRTHIAHSSAALYSAVLKYRVPGALLDFMQQKREWYLAKMETKHRFNHKPETSPEIYFTGPAFMVSAGGRYKFYRGANFPVAQRDFLVDEAPWVYDVISRSSSILLHPLPDRNMSLQEDLLQFKGPQWKENNLAVYKNFIYGYSETAEYRSGEWPCQIPETWKDLEQYSFTRGRFDYRLFDVRERGLYVICTRLRHRDTRFKYEYQKYARGTIEMVDASRTPDFQTLIRQKRTAALYAGDEYMYTLWNGERIYLNSRYSRNRKGIKWIESPGTDSAGTGRQQDFVKSIPFEQEDFPLLKVEAVDSISMRPGRVVAFADGRGNLFVHNSFTGDSLKILFESWWYPRRMISGVFESAY